MKTGGISAIVELVAENETCIFSQFNIDVRGTFRRTGKKRTILRKKSHILLAGYLADQMNAADSLQMHRKAFCLGSILPDCKPSFLTTRHEFFGTFDAIQERLRFLVESGFDVFSESAFWRKIGEVIHYIADYFTFPHNKNFSGSFMEHNHYEKELKNSLKEFIQSGEAEEYVRNEKMIHFGSFQELVSYVEEKHDLYLEKISSIKEDIRYILLVCLQVVQGVIQLCMEHSSLRFAVV